MKRRIILSITTLVAAGLLLSGVLFTKTEPKRAQLLCQVIYSGLDTWHFSGKNLNDDFSQKAFGEYLEQLDFGKRFLLQEDIDEFIKYKNKIDDMFVNGDTAFMEFAAQRIKIRVEQVVGFYEQFLEKPFDFSKDEDIEMDAEKRKYCTNQAELKEYWRKILKARTLGRYLTYLKSEKKTKHDPKLEEKARKAVAKSFKRIFDRIQQTNKKDALSIYINSLIHVYDPHTNYLPALEKETFDMQMSGSFEGIGAVLREDEGYVGVAEIIPGGPSWKQKELKATDKILKVGQANDEPEDIVGMRVQDAVKLIRGKKGTLVKLTVQKPDGRVVVIPIIRDVVILEETFAKSAVVSDKESDKRYGYILLPKFYNDFGRANGRTSTVDVRKEIERLKTQNVDGIILDLRNNNGGALRDAVRMSGLFIPEGPIVQVKDRNTGIRKLRDPDPETRYDGPLVVLINTFSASASEILAAALQDYGRAVIVGSPNSFGKGTVQVMVDLDRFIMNKKEKIAPLGAMTITIQQFYRINGHAIQHRGVKSDIVLPDQFSAFEIGEKHLDFSLNWNAIPAAYYQKWTPKLPDLNILAENSRKRLTQEPRFKLLEEMIKKQKERLDHTRQPLHLSKALKRQEMLRKEGDKLNKLQEKSCNINVTPSHQMKKNGNKELNKIQLERQTEWFKQIDQDIQIKEAMAVLSDINTLQQGPTSN